METGVVPLLCPDHRAEPWRRRSPQLEVDDQVNLPAEFVQTALRKGGKLFGFVGRIQDQALKVDEHEVVVRAVLGALIECERWALAKRK